MRRSTDEEYMERACRLALRGLGTARPNPMVGAVLVKDGAVIGTGYHRRPGEPHAEVVAVSGSRIDPEGSTLYVNLEPCCHFGRTPPCVDYILSRKIRRVVIGTVDPNPLVNGRSIERLRAEGVDVVCGVLEERCRKVNEVFLKYIRTQRPFVILKVAMSLDGKIASSSRLSRWISSDTSRKSVHRLRGMVDAVMVGSGTVAADDPLLTVRQGKSRSGGNPLRVVLDSGLSVPMTANVVRTAGEARTLIATTDRAPVEKAEALREKGVEILVFPADDEGRVPMGAVFAELGQRGIQSVLVEGGSRVFTDALQRGLADKLLVFVAPSLLGGRTAPSFFEGRGVGKPSEAIKIHGMEVKRSGPDILIQGYLHGW